MSTIYHAMFKGYTFRYPSVKSLTTKGHLSSGIKNNEQNILMQIQHENIFVLLKKVEKIVK